MTANFVLASDNNYARHLGVCSYSVMHTMCPEVDRVRLFVLDCGISEENKARLTAQARRFQNAEINFFDIRPRLENVSPKIVERWHRAVYGRLFFIDLLDLYDDLDRLIYLDCDTVMERPVTDLFTLDLQGKCIAGVGDGDNGDRRVELGMPADSVYINSGVLVIDTVRWRELNATQRMIDYINSFPEELKYPDQDAINYILCGEVLMLKPEYNMMWMICDSDVKIMLKRVKGFVYTAEELHFALHNARIFHFAGHNIWRYYGITPIPARSLNKFIQLSDWRDCKRSFQNPVQFLLWAIMTAKRFLTGNWK